jgi:hypothetical protein
MVRPQSTDQEDGEDINIYGAAVRPQELLPALHLETYTVRVSDSEGCFIDLNVTITGPPAPITGQIELLNGLACAGANDGSARVFNMAGGWGGFTYLWSNGETTATAFNFLLEIIP